MNTSKQITVVFYANDARTIVRTRAYATRRLADLAMDRARKLGQCSAIASTRTADDSPTCHH